MLRKDSMKPQILDGSIRQYQETHRVPDARLFKPGDLVRFRQVENGLAAGTVLRVSSVNKSNQTVELRRKNGKTVLWKPSETVEVFERGDGEVKVGTILEWGRDSVDARMQSGDLARVLSVDPQRGVTIASRKRGEVTLQLDAGTWHYSITRDETIGHHRERGPHRLEPYRDVDPIPETTTHEESIDRLARPFSLKTHGSPPPIDALARGDLVYVTASRSEIPDNHVFVVAEIDRKRGRVRLVEGRELSAQPGRSADVWWRPRPDDEVRLYKPAKTLAAQDLLVWKRDDATLLVRQGEYAEVVQVFGDRVAVSGMTSTPDVLEFDQTIWRARHDRQTDSYHLTRAEQRSRAKPLTHELTETLQMALR